MSVTPRQPRYAAQDRKVMFLAIGFMFLGVFVGSVFLLDYLSEMHARNRLLAVIAESPSVMLEGEQLGDPSVVLNALRRLTHVPAQHSGPIEPVRVSLQGRRDTIAIVVARDSNTPQEFWIYRSGSNWNNDPLGQVAGGLVSATLDQFLRKRARI